MEVPSLPQKSRSQLRYSLSTISQQLKTMATTTTTTATASAPISPRTRSIQQHQQQPKQDTYISGKPTPSTSSSSSYSIGSKSSSSKKRPSTSESPIPEHNNNNNNNTTSDIQSTVIITTPTSSTTTTTTCPSITRHIFDESQVTHDPKNYMFKLCLDSKGNIAALCYLPTRFTTLLEFYHTEVPLAYRHLGIGDLLVQRAFEWVEQSNLLVIPSCSFVLRYLKTHYPDRNSGIWKYVVDDEHTGLERLASRD